MNKESAFQHTTESDENIERLQTHDAIRSERKKRDNDRERASFLEQHPLINTVASAVKFGDSTFKEKAYNHQLQANVLLFELKGEKHFAEYKEELKAGTHKRSRQDVSKKEKAESIPVLFTSIEEGRYINLEKFLASPVEYVKEIRIALEDERKKSALHFLKKTVIGGVKLAQEQTADQRDACREVLLSFISEYPRLFSNLCKDEDVEVQKYAIGLIGKLLTGSDLQSQLAVALLKAHIEVVERVASEVDMDFDTDLVSHNLRYNISLCGDTDLEEVLDKWMIPLVEEGNFNRGVLNAFENTKRSKKEYEAALSTFIASKGLEPKSVIAAWKQTKDRFRFNAFNLKQIEDERPGAAAVLDKEFGIKAYARYPKEMLIEQYDNRDKDIPYGVVIYPRSDHNGAFTQDTDVLKKFWQDIREKYGIRVMEASSIIDLARHLISSDNRYGDENKISFAVIAGHGNKESIQFGEHNFTPATFLSWAGFTAQKDLNPLSSLTKTHLMGRGVARMKSFFVEDPQMVLISCSTGIDNGIGQEMSDVVSGKLIAPDVDTNLKELNVSFENNKLHISALYHKEGIEKIFKAGKKL